MADLIVSASILAADFRHLEDQIRQAEAGGTDWIHLDVMDGQFVPNISMGPMVVETCRQVTRLPIDVHLMIEHPERHIKAFAEAGASTLSVHIEGNPNIHRTLQEIRQLGVQPSITLNPGTPASAIEAVLPFVDMVLVMTVNPGFGGQTFIPECSRKVAEIDRMAHELGYQIPIEVDGGIDASTLPDVYHTGARVFVAGTSIFRHPQGIAAGIQALRKSIF